MERVRMGRWIYIVLIVMVLMPMDLFGWGFAVTPAFALFLGLMFAFVFPCPYPKFNKKMSKYLLQASVVGLGFGMNVVKSLQSGAEGMTFTVVSVIGVMLIGVYAGALMMINRKTSYLISSGTAICGGSAIAAVGPVLKANENEMAVSLGVIFVLNAIALFIFPPLGHLSNMSETQFGTWAAIAIHDTSSVVGAGEAYGTHACELATLIKLTRALWIIPLALFTIWYFRDKHKEPGAPKAKIAIPWFIFMFIGAMFINTYAGLPEEASRWLVYIAKKGLILTLFLIGASLSLNTIKAVGFKPFVLAVFLWIVIGVTSFIVVKLTIV